MEYLTTKTGKTIEVDEIKSVARVIDIKALAAQRVELKKRIAVNPEPGDKELLAWARVNYPFVNHEKEREELEKINLILEAIKAI